MEEKQLIVSVMKGDEEAFEHLVSLYQSKALRTAYLICQRQEMAKDIVQETFVRCYLHLHTLNNPEVFRSWFYRILTRTAFELCTISMGCPFPRSLR